MGQPSAVTWGSSSTHTRWMCTTLPILFRFPWMFVLYFYSSFFKTISIWQKKNQPLAIFRLNWRLSKTMVKFIHLFLLTLFSWDRLSHRIQSSLFSPGLVASQPQESSVSTSTCYCQYPALEWHVRMTRLAFYVRSGDLTSGSDACTAASVLHPWSLLPSPYIIIFINLVHLLEKSKKITCALNTLQAKP